jgi:hypothetical protein
MQQLEEIATKFFTSPVKEVRYKKGYRRKNMGKRRIIRSFLINLSIKIV